MVQPAVSGSPCHCSTLRQAARQVTRLCDRHLAPAGIRASQFAVLRALARNEPITVQGLADRSVMDRTTMSRALRPLQRDGFVSIEPGVDGRTRMLTLTPAGHALLEQVAPAWDRAQAEFEAQFGVERTRALRGELSQVALEMV